MEGLFQDLTGNNGRGFEEKRRRHWNASSSSGFGLSASGRSFGSGQDPAPVVGVARTAFTPVVLLDEDDPPVVKLTNDDDE
jgi:hypothetical protein